MTYPSSCKFKSPLPLLLLLFQLMDLFSYEAFQLTIPLELRGEVEEGDEIEYIQALGRKKIERKKS
ncbi:hypothetical protein AKJ57_04750 [candidate division MSBL1 archaeon SCGC-AAA259A05]|uniref:Uncharacterized protein n=1 Tax=candidate division MSBL1 archaeon SCGC-AAA259A05 TaxID=1698259 RepID=A0A133U6R6_9EURY|nr:hypothetical protein AKJ57_04750 [candidate division MSBL1 archaeon SCGC-AAA259A05]